MDKNMREKKKPLEFRTSSSTKQEGVQNNDFPVPRSQHRTFDGSRPSGLRLRRRAPTLDQISDNGFYESYPILAFDSHFLNNCEDVEIEAAGATVPYSNEDEEIDGSLKQSSGTSISTNEDEQDNVSLSSEENEVVSDVGLIHYLGIGRSEGENPFLNNCEAAGATVPCSQEDEEIDGSLKQSSGTTISTNEDEQDNVSLSFEESEVVSDVGLIDDLSIGRLELESARQDKNDKPIVTFPGNENFSCIEIEEDASNDMRQMKGKVVREKKINDILASLGSNEIEKSCGGVHQIKNENSSDDHEAHKRNCGNHKDALEWIFMITNILLELPSAFLDHLASVHKPQYALWGILISVAALLLCIVELIFKARREKVTWKWRGRLLPCFYSRHNQKLFHTFKDNIIGVVVAFCQFIIITINYAFLRQGAGKPIHISVWPIIFGLGQICSKIF